MSQMSHIVLLCLVCCVVSTAQAQEEQKGPVKKTIDAADHAAIKAGHAIEVRVDKHLINPAPHQAGRRNIVSSAFGGFGRLLRNVSVETGKFAGVVGVNALKLGKNSAKAVQQSLKESAKRIVNPRRKKVPSDGPQVVVIEQQVAPQPQQNQPQQDKVEVDELKPSLTVAPQEKEEAPIVVDTASEIVDNSVDTATEKVADDDKTDKVA